MEKLIEKLEQLTDTRRKWGNLRHKLVDIVFIGLVSVICGGSDFEYMEDTGHAKREWFEKYLELPNGIPDSDTFRRVFERLDPAARIREKGADYVLGLKGNQGSLYKDVKLYFDTETLASVAKTLDKDHGRVEQREYYLETDISWLSQRPEWVDLNAIGMVRTSVTSVKTRAFMQECRYFITSLAEVRQFASAVRKYWSIESQLHWQPDVTFREDDSRARKDNSPLSLNILRKEALRLLRQADFRKRVSVRRKMARAAMDNAALGKSKCWGCGTLDVHGV